VLNKNTASDLVSSDLSNINASNCDIIELKDGQDIASQNSYELIEEVCRQDDLLVNSSCSVNLDPVVQATKDVNNNVISTEDVNVILAKNKEFNSSKKSNSCAYLNSDDKLRSLLQQVENPFISG
jgi:hypothetical protein